MNTTYLLGWSSTGSSLGGEGEQEMSSISFPVTFSFGSICASQQVIWFSIPITSNRDQSVCLNYSKRKKPHKVKKYFTTIQLQFKKLIVIVAQYLRMMKKLPADGRIKVELEEPRVM